MTVSSSLDRWREYTSYGKAGRNYPFIHLEPQHIEEVVIENFRTVKL